MAALPPLLVTSVAAAVTAAVGGAGTDVTSRWYAQLDKPSWQPPGPAFGIVWGVLYVLLAGAAGRGLDRAEQRRGRRRGRGWSSSWSSSLKAGSRSDPVPLHRVSRIRAAS